MLTWGLYAAFKSRGSVLADLDPTFRIGGTGDAVAERHDLEGSSVAWLQEEELVKVIIGEVVRLGRVLGFDADWVFGIACKGGEGVKGETVIDGAVHLKAGVSLGVGAGLPRHGCVVADEIIGSEGEAS